MEDKKIYGALIEAQRIIGGVGKDGRNEFDGYNYRKVDDVMDAVHEAFCKAGIVVMPEVVDYIPDQKQRKGGGTMMFVTVKMNYRFVAEDGSSITATVIGQGADVGDKAGNKALAAAYKYCMFQVLAIPSGEMHDSEEDTPQIAYSEKDAQEKAALVGELVKAAAAADMTLTALAAKAKTTDITSLPPDRLKKCIEWLKAKTAEKAKDTADTIQEIEAAAAKAGISIEELEEQTGSKITEATPEALEYYKQYLEKIGTKKKKTKQD